MVGMAHREEMASKAFEDLARKKRRAKKEDGRRQRLADKNFFHLSCSPPLLDLGVKKKEEEEEEEN